MRNNVDVNAEDYLISHGVKPSVQRLAIMNYLFLHKTHPTADEIYMSLHSEIVTLSKTTVYNTLKLLAEKGAILALGVDDKNMRFDGNISAHAHFFCTKCGKVYDFGFEIMAKINSLASVSAEGYRIDDSQLNCKGICSECARREAESE